MAAQIDERDEFRAFFEDLLLRVRPYARVVRYTTIGPKSKGQLRDRRRPAVVDLVLVAEAVAPRQSAAVVELASR